MRKRVLLGLILGMMLLSAACARSDATPAQVLDALTKAEIGLPAGQVYLASAPEDDAAYLSPDLMAALYGQGELPWQLSLIEDYGLFLSTAQHPCEFAVFRTYARSDTDEVAAMCHARLDTLRAHYKAAQAATQSAAQYAEPYAHYVRDARVVVIGKYVLLIVSSDADHALRTAKGVI